MLILNSGANECHSTEFYIVGDLQYKHPEGPMCRKHGLVCFDIEDRMCAGLGG